MVLFEFRLDVLHDRSIARLARFAEFFTTEFEGTLVTDFWGAYNAVACADRQMCLVHLLRELETTVKYKQPDDGWSNFEKKLRRILADSIRLWKKRDEIDDGTLIRRREDWMNALHNCSIPIGKTNMLIV